MSLYSEQGEEGRREKLRSLHLTERDVDYIKTPLVYETTGGFGKEATKWFKKVQLEFRKNNGDSSGLYV